MANTPLPLAMFYLSVLSRNPSVLMNASLPPRETVLDPQIRDVARILDAIVHFLPTARGLIYYLHYLWKSTIIIVRITVAGNTKEHFHEAFGQTSAGFIQSLCTTMHSITTSEDPERFIC